MKRILAILLVICSLCSLFSGCGEKTLSDGTYTMEVTLTGGSGRATVESPANVVIANGTATATIVWSSPFYEYMLVDETKYDPIQESGNASFEIPVTLDTDMVVVASTVAMSTPHQVEYTLHFDSTTAKGA